MHILMMTNTYLPHVGGVARSVATFSSAFRRAGHRVLVVAPTFPGMPPGERDVLRVPAIRNFNGSDFSVRIPVPGLGGRLDRFRPDIVHTHHPFLLGGAALRYATSRGLPLIFTHHTMYEQYTHYLPAECAATTPYLIALATEYANRCEGVVAPSESVAAVLRERGVKAPVTVIPTGIDRAQLAAGDGGRLRRRAGIPADAFVVGHVGRLAPEKNIGFLAEAAAAFLLGNERARLLVVGSGPAAEEVRAALARCRVAGRLHFTGTLLGRGLANAYQAMDVFAFSSKSETQGMVLAEAMAAGVPVVALDAPGAREVVRDGENGRLLPAERVEPFRAALAWVAARPGRERAILQEAARGTAAHFDQELCARKALRFYVQAMSASRRNGASFEHGPLAQARRRLETEWDLWSSRAEAAIQAWRQGSRNKDEA
ncbi:MAG: glycosyltransferase [Desulfobacteraceae bacterium]|nr:glycosyltransferase [Desulfobacteraceae bacterium]